MNTYTALLYNETNFLTLILLIIVLLRTKSNEDIRINLPSFMGFITSLIVLTVGDIFWAFVNGNIIPFTVFGGYATNLVYFIGTLASVYYLFMLYQDNIGYNGDYVKKSILYAIPFVIALVFVCLTPVTGLVFTYEGDVYKRGPFYAVTLMIPYAFVLVLCVSSFIRSFMSKYFVIRKSLRIMTLYSLGTMALSVFQLVSTNVFPLYVVGGVLISVMVYIESLNKLNTIDSLTHLETRMSFENKLSDLLEKECDAGKCIHIILADIIDFRSVNGIYGREEGDRVLSETAQVVRSCMPTGWLCARYGGDEFALAGVCAPEEIEHICTQIENAIAEQNMSSAKPYSIALHIAYSARSYACKNVTDFLKLADRRLEEASVLAKNSNGIVKRSAASKNPPAQNASDSTSITQQDINLWMNDALKNGEFVPYFQPQVNVSDGTISGAEALARWIHPEKGMIFPSVFIPVFERNGFIYEMDKAIWHGVCGRIRKWKDEGIAIPSISINVSRWDVVQNDFTSTLLSYLEEFRLSPSDIHLEITESAYLFDQDYLIRLMEELQSKGFEIEMDDFGSGYSSLTAFKDLPFNLIKLDSSLIRESTKTQKAASILEGFARLTKSLNIPLIAEGVEYREQADFLQQIGCCKMQGYLFSKPLPEDKFLSFLSDWNKEHKIK